MALLEWNNEKFSVGVDVIDQQHKKLVELINTLHEARLAGSGVADVGEVIRELIAYTRYHFRTEEQLMQQYDFPTYREHKLKHDVLSRRVLGLFAEFSSGRRAVTIELSIFLKAWLIEHILGTDRELAVFLQAKGIESPVVAAGV